MIPRGASAGSHQASGMNRTENRLFQGSDGQLRRVSLPRSIGGGSGNTLGYQRISPWFAANNNGNLLNQALKSGSQLNHHQKNAGMGNDGNNIGASSLPKGGLGGGGSGMFKSGASSDTFGTGQKRKRSNSNDNNNNNSSLDMNDPALLQRLNQLGGGFPMPKWARKAANATNASSHGSNNNNNSTAASPGRIGNNFYSGMGIIRSERKGMSIQEMMKEKKRLEVERVNNLKGGFPLPPQQENESLSATVASLHGFRQVWLQTPPEYRKLAFLMRLERSNLIPSNNNKKKARLLDDEGTS